MQDGVAGHPRYDIDCLVIANQHRMRLNNTFQRLLVSGSDFVCQRRIGNLVQCSNHLHVALTRRRPVELGHGNVLLFQVIAEHRDTDVNHVQRLVKQCLAHQASSPLQINSRASNPVLVLLLAQITPASVSI